MQTLDYVVSGRLFRGHDRDRSCLHAWVKRQEDFFMGGRSFGRLLQTFAAFGSGTGANDPIQVGRTTWTSGLSGIWSVLLFLFVTPFYWIVSVWYRRMRHVTLGDWFVERYESKGMGAAYTLFGFAYYMIYLSTAFTAISKVAESIVGFDQVWGLGACGDRSAWRTCWCRVIALLVIVLRCARRPARGLLDGPGTGDWHHRPLGDPCTFRIVAAGREAMATSKRRPLSRSTESRRPWW